MEELKICLQETFAGNFVSYYRSHVAHVNIQGRNFYQDHKLLQKIYEYFQIYQSFLSVAKVLLLNEGQTVLKVLIKPLFIIGVCYILWV